MSETVHFKGVLIKLERNENESLEEQCKRLMEDKELPSYFDNYQEFLLDSYYHRFAIHNNCLYQVEKEDLDPDGDIFKASLKENGEIDFEVRYYNGGCGFEEAINEALRSIK